MVKACCIKQCKSEWKRTEDVTFHKFPLEPESRDRFVAAIPSELQPTVTKYSVICSKHFTTESFQPPTCTSIRRRLKPEAIPTLFGNDCFVIRPPINEQESRSPLTKDVAVETSSQYLPPSNEVVQLRNKIQILQKRLRRRDIRVNNMNNVIEHLKKNRVSTRTIKEGNIAMEHESATTPTVEASAECLVSYSESPEMQDLETNATSSRDTDTDAESRQQIQHDHRYTCTPKSYRKKLHSMQKDLCRVRNENRVLNQKVKRLQMKVSSLKQVVRKLEELNLVS